VNITGCKKLNASDDLILKAQKINVDAGEDIFRFHLVPASNSDLPKITSHILKTRSTLSLHKVYKYLVKKLSDASVDGIVDRDETSAENMLHITCNKNVLDRSLQLKQIKELYWPDPEPYLTLQYRRDTNNTEEETIYINQSNFNGSTKQ